MSVLSGRVRSRQLLKIEAWPRIGWPEHGWKWIISSWAFSLQISDQPRAGAERFLSHHWVLCWRRRPFQISSCFLQDVFPAFIFLRNVFTENSNRFIFFLLLLWLLLLLLIIIIKTTPHTILVKHERIKRKLTNPNISAQAPISPDSTWHIWNYFFSLQFEDESKSNL